MGANTRRGGGHNSSIVFNCATSGILEELIFSVLFRPELRYAVCCRTTQLLYHFLSVVRQDSERRSQTISGLL